MIVPIDSTLVYVEPIFLEAENAAIPQLERLVLVQSGTVVLQPTFETAVAALLRGQSPASPGSVPTTAAVSARASSDPDAMAEARRLMAEAEAYLRAGDWASFGRTWQDLSDLLSGAGGGF
jgi:uncharacterized membrane protein (UPF0182 family)